MNTVQAFKKSLFLSNPTLKPHLQYINKRIQRNGNTRYEVFITPALAEHAVTKLRESRPLWNTSISSRNSRTVRRRTTWRKHLRDPSTPPSLSLITWNIQGLLSKFTLLSNLIHENTPHIICIQESLRSKANFPLKIGKYVTYEKTRIDKQSGARGICTLVDTSPHPLEDGTSSNPIADWTHHEIDTKGANEILVTRISPPRHLRSTPRSIVVCNLYINSNANQKDASWTTAIKHINAIRQKYPDDDFYIAGDMNCDKSTANRWIQSIDAHVKRLDLQNGYISFMSHSNGTSKCIDHIFTPSSSNSSLHPMDFYNSDHRALLASIEMIPAPSNSKKAEHTARLSPKLVTQNAHLVRSYNQFSVLDSEDDLEMLDLKLKTAISNCAKEFNLSYPASPPQRSPLSKKAREILRQKRRAREHFLKARSEDNWNAVKALSKELRQVIKLDNQMRAVNTTIRIADEIITNGDTAGAWDHIMRNYGVSRRSAAPKSAKITVTGPNNELLSNEEQLLEWEAQARRTFGDLSTASHPPTEEAWHHQLTNNDTFDDIDYAYGLLPQQDDGDVHPFPHHTPILEPVEKLNEPISWKECAFHIRKLGEKKAPGEDGIISEILKTEIMNLETPYNFQSNTPSSEIGKAIFKLITKTWEEGRAPSSWKSSVIHPIPKCPSPSKPSDFRPISLVPTLMKLLTSILARRILTHCNNRLSPSQAGFRQKEECVAQAILLHDIIEQNRIARQPLHAAFLDLQQAFDSVPHQTLFHAAERIGITGKSLNIIKDIYTGSVTKFRINGNVTEEVEVLRGVKQGDPLSPILFIIVMDSLAKILTDRGLGPTLNAHRDPTFHHQIPCLLYADDIVLLSNTSSDLKAMLDLTTAWLNQHCMTANPKKSGIMVFNSGRKYPDDFFLIQQKPIPMVREYKYLGIVFNESADRMHMARARCEVATNTLNRLLPILRSKRNSIHTKTLILKMILIPTLTYGAALWCDDQWALDMAQQILDKACRAAFRISSPQHKTISAIASTFEIPTVKHVATLALLGNVVRAKFKNSWIAHWCLPPAAHEEAYHYTLANTAIRKLEEILRRAYGENIVLQIISNLDTSDVDSYTNIHQKIIKAIDKDKRDTHIRNLARCKGRYSGTQLPNLNRLAKRNPILSTGIITIAKMITGDFWTQHRIKYINNATPDHCIHCNTRVETVTHLLFECPAWNTYREGTLAKLNMQRDEILALLKQQPEDIDNRHNPNPAAHNPAPNPNPQSLTVKEKAVLNNINNRTNRLDVVASYLELLQPRRQRALAKAMLEGQ